MGIGDEYTEITVETIDIRDLAVRFNAGEGDFWIPKACMKSWPDLFETGTALVKTRFAVKKRWPAS